MSKSSQKDQPEIPSPQGFVLIVNRQNKTTFIFLLHFYVGAVFVLEQSWIFSLKLLQDTKLSN